jgi:hypothetical protein
MQFQEIRVCTQIILPRLYSPVSFFLRHMLLYTIIKLWLLQRGCKVFLCLLPQFWLVVL